MRLAFALFAAVVPLAAGCTANARATSDPPVVVNPGSTLAFAPSTIDVWRTAGACGVSNPPYSPADIYNLDAIGAQASGPLTALSVTVENGSVTIGTPYDLALDAPIASTNPGGDSRAQNGASSDHVVSFQFQWGAAHPERSIRARSTRSPPRSSPSLRTTAIRSRSTTSCTSRISRRSTSPCPAT